MFYAVAIMCAVLHVTIEIKLGPYYACTCMHVFAERRQYISTLTIQFCVSGGDGSFFKLGIQYSADRGMLV